METMKEYRLKIEDRKSYLYAYVSGKDSMEVSLAYWKEIFDTCKRLNYHNVLVEEDLQGSPVTVDYFEFGIFLSNIVKDFRLKIAFIDRHTSHAPDNLFSETVAKNRGVHVKVCKNIEIAEGWLSS